MGFVDLHSHVLPGLDDGARTMSDALELLALLARMGFEIVCATPHQKVGSWVPSSEAVFNAYTEVRRALETAQPALDLRLGAENFWDELFLARSIEGKQPTYTGQRAFLFEVSPAAPPPMLDEQLFRIRMKGLLPVLAHPERYHSLCRQLPKVEALKRTAALVIDLGALDGAHGPVACETAQRLVREDLVHAAASDVHHVDDARAAAAGINWLKKKVGPKRMQLLLDENPRRILQGDLPD
jgi:protein-tyrosine phosphatase